MHSSWELEPDHGTAPPPHAPRGPCAVCLVREPCQVPQAWPPADWARQTKTLPHYAQMSAIANGQMSPMYANVAEQAKIAVLKEYVSRRQPMLERIGNHYGVPASKAKYAVLRVLNGGAITTWVNDPDVGCTRGKDESQADLRDLEEEARVVRDAFFSMDQFKDHVACTCVSR